MKYQVLSIGKALLENKEYDKFCEEYEKVERYINRLKVDTQVKIILNFINKS